MKRSIRKTIRIDPETNRILVRLAKRLGLSETSVFIVAVKTLDDNTDVQ
jgi:hypothetical protein